MKKLLLCATLIAFGGQFSMAQDGVRKVPEAIVKTVDGKDFNTKSLANDGKPIIVSFWATWCTPCKKELDNIAEVYEDWQEETGVKLVAVSIDDTRSMTRAVTLANGKGWDYEVLLDPNQDFKRAMNVNTVPHTFLIDGAGNIVYSHNSYSEGDEDELYIKVQEYAGQ